MPTSHFYQLDQLTELIFILNPKRILDIGVGFGKYGFLAREYLDLNRDGNYKNFKRRFDGIEAFEPYLNPAHKFIYNKIYVGDALKIIPNLKRKYDLVLLLDCLEHFTYKDGIKLLESLTNISKMILISTPKDISHQEAAFGNPYETHRFQWTKNHFKKFPDVAFFKNKYSLVCSLGKDANLVAREISIMKLKEKLVSFFPFLKAIKRLVKSTS